jgi:hypothetical protein
MPAPSPEPGGQVAAVAIVRHSFDTLGYPMHVSLLEKLFGTSYKISVYASNQGEMWQYDSGSPASDEKSVTLQQSPRIKIWGPMRADGPIPPDLQKAFAFAEESLASIRNLSDAQKQLGNYIVMFVDDGTTTWVEFGPSFAPGETPHLGCQTQLGRDMVFGYDDKQTGGERKTGEFLQCF